MGLKSSMVTLVLRLVFFFCSTAQVEIEYTNKIFQKYCFRFKIIITRNNLEFFLLLADITFLFLDKESARSLLGGGASRKPPANSGYIVQGVHVPRYPPSPHAIYSEI